MRRVLMIAYRFPPSLAVGRMRTVKFCKYLPEFGWQPVVVTCRAPTDYDPVLLDEIPKGTEVHRVGHGTLQKQFLACAAKARAMGLTGRSIAP